MGLTVQQVWGVRKHLPDDGHEGPLYRAHFTTRKEGRSEMWPGGLWRLTGGGQNERDERESISAQGCVFVSFLVD